MMIAFLLLVALSLLLIVSIVISGSMFLSLYYEIKGEDSKRRKNGN